MKSWYWRRNASSADSFFAAVSRLGPCVCSRRAASSAAEPVPGRPRVPRLPLWRPGRQPNLGARPPATWTQRPKSGRDRSPPTGVNREVVMVGSGDLTIFHSAPGNDALRSPAESLMTDGSGHTCPIRPRDCPPVGDAAPVGGPRGVPRASSLRSGPLRGARVRDPHRDAAAPVGHVDALVEPIRETAHVPAGCTMGLRSAGAPIRAQTSLAQQAHHDDQRQGHGHGRRRRACRCGRAGSAARSGGLRQRPRHGRVWLLPACSKSSCRHRDGTSGRNDRAQRAQVTHARRLYPRGRRRHRRADGYHRAPPAPDVRLGHMHPKGTCIARVEMPPSEYVRIRFHVTVEGSVPTGHLASPLCPPSASSATPSAFRSSTTASTRTSPRTWPTIPVEEVVRLKRLNDTEPSGVLAVSDDLDPDRAEGSELTHLVPVPAVAAAVPGRRSSRCSPSTRNRDRDLRAVVARRGWPAPTSAQRRGKARAKQDHGARHTLRLT